MPFILMGAWKIRKDERPYFYGFIALWFYGKP
jgi:hypothetical protein